MIFVPLYLIGVVTVGVGSFVQRKWVKDDRPLVIDIIFGIAWPLLLFLLFIILADKCIDRIKGMMGFTVPCSQYGEIYGVYQRQSSDHQKIYSSGQKGNEPLLPASTPMESREAQTERPTAA